MFNRDVLEEFARRWRLKVRMPLSRLGSVLQGGLLAGALLLFGILGYSPQGRELFRVLLEQADPSQIVLTALASTLLSGLLFYIYRSFLPAHVQDGQCDGSLERLAANSGLYLMAAAPWLSGVASLLGMWAQLGAARSELTRLLEEAHREAPNSQMAEQGAATLAAMGQIADRVTPALAIIAGLLAVTVLVLAVCESRRGGAARTWATALLLAAATLVIAVLGVGAAASDALFVRAYQGMGPLAAGILATTGLFMIGLAISWAARGCGLSAYFAALIVLLVYWGGIELSSRVAGQKGQQPVALAAAKPPTFDNAAKAWLKDRETTPPRHVPMLVLSAQGGGMYAAIASSLFLARLQDAEPAFDRSVLAISAVSGGAIGTALYSVLASDTGCAAGPAVAARSPGKSGRKIEDGIAPVLLDSHLAPIIGNLPADILRKLPPFVFRASTDRAQAFRESLVRSCPALAQASVGDWSARTRRPALVLNTTWMSNGHRVAFAPFQLRSAGDGTLWSFDDVYPNATPSHLGAPFRPTLVDAAVTSARFPGALPPLSLTAGRNRHNYGDGGYADASGVTTALELYEEARKLARGKPNVKPLLVMLTFDYKPVTPDHSGTPLVETVAPLEAILGVRENLSGKSITRAESLPREEGGGDNVLRVSLNPDELGLALGLQLSKSSYDVLSLLLGRPQWCPSLAYAGTNPILRNSCAAAKVLRTVRG